MMCRLLVILTCVSVLLAPVAALAYDPFSGPCSGNGTGESTVCANIDTSNPLIGSNGLIVKIGYILAILSGIAAVVTIVVSGLLYITSGGDAAKAKGARDAIVSTVIGLVVIALASTLIAFVLSRI